MDNDRAIAKNYIHKLSEKDLVDFFYETISDRNEDQKYPDGFCKDRYVIAQTSFGAYEHKDDEEHYLEVMARPVDELAELDWLQEEKNVYEQGQCPKCKVLVTCVAKRAICPICDHEAECT